MFERFKQKFKAFMISKGGFSLVELIVVIAIMAVMAAVLAPALLGYVETSRAQKDDSAFSEVVEATKLALADEKVYDEVLEHSVYDNVSCFVDKQSESDFVNNKIVLKDAHGDRKEQYMFNDDARLLDEVPYYAAGNMRGLTVTFARDKNTNEFKFDLKNGVINKFVGRKTGYLYENPELYNRIRSVIGDTLDASSQTYRNSEYTLFIKLGSTGGADSIKQDAIQVWGQFNGTNLSNTEKSFNIATNRVVGNDGKNDNIVNADSNYANPDTLDWSQNNANRTHSTTIPDGAKYVSSSSTFSPGSEFPTNIKEGDCYYYGQYIYKRIGGSKGWQVHLNEAVVDRNQEEYEPILTSINGMPITSLYTTFANCTNLKRPPQVPDTVTAMNATFQNCTSLVDLSTYKLPSKLVNCGLVNNYPGTFAGCTNLKYAPKLPSTIGYNDCYRMFYRCTSLVEKPVGYEILNQAIAFEGCAQFGY